MNRGVNKVSEPTAYLRSARTRKAVVLSMLAVFAIASHANGDNEFSKETVAHFDQKVAPLLAKHCFRCHSHQTAKAKNGLMLDSRESILKGGESGPALVPKTEKDKKDGGSGHNNKGHTMWFAGGA